MQDDDFEIIVSPSRDDFTEPLVNAMNEHGIEYIRNDQRVQHYDAEGTSHLATIITVSIASFAYATKHLSPVLVAYFKSRMARKIKIRMKGQTIEVTNIDDLNAAIKAIQDLERSQAKLRNKNKQS